jgi:hypothetical protein
MYPRIWSKGNGCNSLTRIIITNIPPFHITDAVRPQIRVQATKKNTGGERRVWKEARAAPLTFRIKELPPHVYFCNIKIEDATLVTAVRQCCKCGKFGHVSKFCTKEKQCFSCGEAKHEGFCMNGNHRANNDQWPVIKK